MSDASENKGVSLTGLQILVVVFKTGDLRHVYNTFVSYLDLRSPEYLPPSKEEFTAALGTLLAACDVDQPRTNAILHACHSFAWFEHWTNKLAKYGVSPTPEIEDLAWSLFWEEYAEPVIFEYAKVVAAQAGWDRFFNSRDSKNRDGFCFDTLIALVERGPLEDGQIASKGGRERLIEQGFAVRVLVDGEDGYTAATNTGGQLYKKVVGVPPNTTLHEAIATRKAKHAMLKMRQG